MRISARTLIPAVLAAATGILASCSSSDGGTGVVVKTGQTILSGDITANRTLYPETTYVISGFVNVKTSTLTIRAGTKLVGDSTVPGSALFIYRGAKIDAQGTATNPIVFTSQRSANNRAPGDWGGLILVGNGKINRAGAVILEGSNASVPNASATGVDYGGGTDNADNSGTLRYVRVEFAGYAVLQDAELNSFTFAAVGSGTTLEYLQSLAGLDDSFEWFGGAVNGRYLVSYESGDDHFDAAEGYIGKNQYLLALQTQQITPRAGTGSLSVDPQGFEIDGCNGSGCTNGHQSTPLTVPVFANFTVIGTGATSSSGTSGGNGIVLRRGAGGAFINGVVSRWPRQAISVRDSYTNTLMGLDSLSVRNLLFVGNGTSFDAASGTNFGTQTAFANASITESTVALTSVFTLLPTTVTDAASLDFSLPTGSPARTGGMAAFSGVLAARTGAFIQGTAFVGAADPAGAKWWQGWTNYATK